MSDPTVDPERHGHDLAARTAAIARRVAGVLDRLGSAESGAPGDAQLLRDWASVVPAAAVHGPAPLDDLSARLDLSEIEIGLVLLAGLPEENEAPALALRRCHPRSDPYPTAGLAAHVFADAVPDRSALRRILHEGPATRSGLLDLTGDAPLFDRSLRLADQVWEALHGHDAWPRSLRRMAVGEPPGGLDGWLGLPAVRRAVAALRAPADRTLLLGTADPAVAASRCAALARAAGTVAVAARFRPDEVAGVGLLALHAALRGGVAVVVVDAVPGAAPVAVELPAMPGPVLVCAAAGTVVPPSGRAVLAVPVGPVGVADRRAAWRAALPGSADQAPVLAARHPLDPAVTAQVALDVEARRLLEPGPVDLAEVSETIRSRAGAALPVGVDLVSPRAGWDRIVLGPEPTAQLRDAVARLDHQARVLDDWGMRAAARADRGVRLLFAGPPGTGKSLAAEVIAAQAGTDLLVVDVARVVSKWLGETEKNLAAAFQIAERTQAVLLLDEADALFATRTQVDDAHDRYANLETAYLLQRLDRFDGLAVLATNLRQNIDAAFVRRMDFVVEFPQPDEAARRALWEQHLPAAVRSGDVDVTLLAHAFPVPGAWIRNVAVGAAFLAAADGGPVRHRHLVAAMRREYAKASRPFPGDPDRRPDAAPDPRAARALASAPKETR